MAYLNDLSRELDLQQGVIDLYNYDNTIFDNIVLPDTIDKTLTIDAIMYKYGHAPLFRPDPTYLKYFIGSWSRKNSYTWSKLQATTLLEYEAINNYDRTETSTDKRTISSNGNESENINRTSSGSDVTNGSTHDSGSSSSSVDEAESTSGQNRETDTKGTATESTISADNSSVYQPNTKEVNSGADTLDSTNSGNRDFESSTRNTTSADQTSNQTINRSDKDDTGRELSRTEDTTETVEHTVRAYGNIGVTTSQQMLEAERQVVQFNVYDFIADSFHNEFCLMLY